MLEDECVRPDPSEKLSQLGLALLKFVSSHRGLTPELFDEYTKRQYLAKAPQRNPFGSDEDAHKFPEFDVFTKLSVLHQLSVWSLWNPDRIRERMEEKDAAQTVWRIEPTGWDSKERTYFVLDDNRLYRKTDPAPPVSDSKPKAKLKSKKPQSRRASKRMRLSNGEAGTPDQEEVTELDESVLAQSGAYMDGLGGAAWKCVAVSLEDYTAFLDEIRRSRDPDEKALFRRITDDVLPEIERAAEAKERRAAKTRREMENVQKLATAKRSSRLADKTQKQREQEEAEEAVRKQRADLIMAHREQEKQYKMEEARESRMLTREQRLKEREVKRILHEEQLAKLEASSDNGESNAARLSERNRKFELERAKSELLKLHEGQDDWDFDCAICGRHGKNLDDGTHSLACESCGVWQHSACHGINEIDAESDDFHFLCASCSKPKKPLKLNFGSPNGTHIHEAQDGGINPTWPVPSVMVPPRNTHSQQVHQPVKYNFPPPQSSMQTLQSPPSPVKYNRGSSDAQEPRIPLASNTNLNGIAITPNHAQHAFSIGASPPSQLFTPEAAHNPFLNHFGRQRPVPSPKVAASPAPSLSATQGATDVRFSPSLSNGGSFGMNANSYTPASARPNAGAFSPMKQPSSPPRPLPAHSPHASPLAGLANGTTSFPPSPFNGAPASSSGISPVKHEPPRPTSSSSLDALASAATAVTPSSSSASRQDIQLLPAVTLSPSVDANGGLVPPPVKKVTTETIPILNDSSSFSAALSSSNQTQNESEAQDKMDLS